MKRRINLNISSIKLPFDKKVRLKLEKLGINVKESYVPMKTDREKLHLFLSKKGHCLPFVKIVNKKQNASTKIAKVIDLTKTNNNDQSQKKRASAKDKKSSALKIKKQRTKAQVQQVRKEKTVKIKTTKPTKGSKKIIPNKEAEEHKTRMEEQKALRAKRMEMREKKREEAHWPVWETLEEGKPLKNKVSQKETFDKNEALEKKVSESSESNAMDFSFNISDSDEDSDDEEKKPAKPIPKWAQGEQFNEAMKKQSATVVDLYLIFEEFLMPDLSEMFTKQRKRFKKRTSSAVWECPPANFRTPFTDSCS